MDESPQAPDIPPTVHIRSLLPSLTPKLAVVAEEILADPAEVVRISVSDLAQRTGTSMSTIVRLCQELGLRGFQDLKLRLVAEETATGFDGPVDTDDRESVLSKVLSSTVDAISHTQHTLDTTSFNQVAELVFNARTIIFVGAGASAAVAFDAAFRFRTLGHRAEFHFDSHMQLTAARFLRPGDIVVAISHSGSTRETLTALEAASSGGAHTVAVTTFARSPLAELADHVLLAGGTESEFRIAAVSSRLAHLAVVDALFVAVARLRPERARAAQELWSDMIAEHRLSPPWATRREPAD
ncbi:MAG: MurR/RpiR family transcriptional regulator [Acidimicrobiia bacterium]|nr:MurR/RpiR family transcriptional regulator [bacterium]MYB11518.1 MurR/RpiR family transcriptional regulator [Acidimicrobiia bacterium]MYG59678.1 MurR/RpiR family transcriptional regulator [Acidimicrobiia bacterium]MYH95800.1 MurR/RpiR family transcriptional regulator [Acidimicrobiia bacterium]MYJ31093.1 MurR/RpiR family transcriptional regulator [Acidimicrobiia bacterium]